MDKKVYDSAINKLKISEDFDQRTIKLLNEEQKVRIKPNNYWRYGIAACSMIVLVLISIFVNNGSKQIDLKRSSVDIVARYEKEVPLVNEVYSLEGLTEDEIFYKYDTSIFMGKVTQIENISIKMGDDKPFYRAIVTIKILESFRGGR